MRPTSLSFSVSEESANELLGLVLSGKKRATSGSVDGCRLSGQRPPRQGDLSVVTDWAGNPRCVIETESVTVLPFDEFPFERAALEGEDGHNESWRKNHRAFQPQGRALTPSTQSCRWPHETFRASTPPDRPRSPRPIFAAPGETPTNRRRPAAKPQ
jgi:uncharacterized protein YhfF